MTATIDTELLEAKVNDMYRDVAEHSHRAYHFELGEKVASNVGVDAARLAAGLVGPSGRAIGVDFSLEQLEKARGLAARHGVREAELRGGRIEDLPLEDASVDFVISNG